MKARTLRAIAAAGAAVALLSGCTSKVSTTIEVLGERDAAVNVSAVFTDEAAELFLNDAKARAKLVEVFTSNLKAKPTVEAGEDEFVVTAQASYEEVTTASGLTGISGLQLSDGGHRLQVKLTQADRIAEAIESQNADQPDAGALTKTMLDNTFVEVSVLYGAGVRSMDLDPLEKEKVSGDVRWNVDEDSATVERPLSNTDDLVMDVRGLPAGDSAKWMWRGAGAGVGIAALAYFLYFRPRARAAS